MTSMFTYEKKFFIKLRIPRELFFDVNFGVELNFIGVKYSTYENIFQVFYSKYKISTKIMQAVKTLVQNILAVCIKHQLHQRRTIPA